VAVFSEKTYKIAVFRALNLGDMLCCLPALGSIKNKFPHASITLIGLPWLKILKKRFTNYFDDFIEFPGFPGLTEIEPKTAEFPVFLKKIHKRRFDLAIQMHGNGIITNQIIELFNAGSTAGFFKERAPNRNNFMRFPEAGHEAERCLKLVKFLGFNKNKSELEFPLLKDDIREYNNIASAYRLKEKKFIILHPGAKNRSRRWNIKGFAEVAETMALEGYSIVITGTGHEKNLCRELQTLAGVETINLCSKTSLGGLAALISKSRIIITNNTGISHIASALNKESVVITTSCDPARWAPMNKAPNKHVYAPVDCRPCGYDICPFGHECSEKITAENVIEQCLELLKQ